MAEKKNTNNEKESWEEQIIKRKRRLNMENAKFGCYLTVSVGGGIQIDEKNVKYLNQYSKIGIKNLRLKVGTFIVIMKLRISFAILVIC